SAPATTERYTLSLHDALPICGELSRTTVVWPGGAGACVPRRSRDLCTQAEQGLVYPSRAPVLNPGRAPVLNPGGGEVCGVRAGRCPALNFFLRFFIIKNGIFADFTLNSIPLLPQ